MIARAVSPLLRCLYRGYRDACDREQRAWIAEVERRAVRTMFVLYALLIVGGIAAFVAVGLTSG